MFPNTLKNAKKWDRFASERLILTPSKIENWHSYAVQLLSDSDFIFKADREEFVSTVLDLLRRSGVPRDKLWRATVKSSRISPEIYSDHVVGIIEIAEKKYIVGDIFSLGRPRLISRCVYEIVEICSLSKDALWHRWLASEAYPDQPIPQFKLSQSSRNKLSECHPALIEITDEAIQKTSVDFGIIAGARTIEQQREYVKAGSSRTMNSRHLKRWCIWKSKRYHRSHAVDVMAYVGGTGVWKPESLYHTIGQVFKEEAKKLNYEITWGGDWGWDFGHFELSWDAFRVER